MLGVGPPRPLPAAAYDLQTALESVQHIATQTLAGVVQGKATWREPGLDFDQHSTTRSQQSRSRSNSPMRGSAGGGRGAAATSVAEEQACAAGLGGDWEKAWPPRELTAALTLVTARQMAHAMRCDSEPLIQVLLHVCFIDRPCTTLSCKAWWAFVRTYAYTCGKVVGAISLNRFSPSECDHNCCCCSTRVGLVGAYSLRGIRMSMYEADCSAVHRESRLSRFRAGQEHVA